MKIEEEIEFLAKNNLAEVYYCRGIIAESEIHLFDALEYYKKAFMEDIENHLKNKKYLIAINKLKLELNI